MSTRLDDIRLGLRFAARLPAFLRTRVGHDDAVAEVRRRLRSRDDDFLFLARAAVYAFDANPFRQLLAAAGCEYGDLERLVRLEGVEGALAVLYDGGVYLTADEFAGRTPVQRGSTVLEARPGLCRNPWSAQHLAAVSGGSSPGEVILDLKGLQELVCDYRLGLDAEGSSEAVKASWTVPGAGGLAHCLVVAAAFGVPPARWFSHVDVRRLDMRYRVSCDVVRWVGRVLGFRFPRPLPVTLEDPLPIARWLASVLRNGRVPYLATYPAAAVRLCEAALDAGVELAGARFSLRGEPVTEGRVATLDRAGVRHTSLYGAMECGVIGQACLAPRAVDEVHLHTDIHAMIQVPTRAATTALPAGALLFSSLRRTARFVLLNVSMGDTATCVPRQCGCPMEAYGFTTHLYAIRSFQKLTGFGMTFADAEVSPILERQLPSRYGGSATDYQLQEEEAEDGRARLVLVIHPRLGPLDEAEVVATFLDAIGKMSETRRLMALTWRSAGVVQVARQPPSVTPSGKILHFRSVPRPS